MKVLLVCTGNVDRSPLAEFLLNKMLAADGVNGVEVHSRGVAAVDGRPMSEGSQAILLFEDDIIASNHRSSGLAETDIHEADLVLTMDRTQARLVLDRYPGAVGKVFPLSEYARVRDFIDIEDPAGQLGDAYYRMKREVQEALSGTLKRMREDGLVARARVAHLQIKADELTRAKRARIANFRTRSCCSTKSMPITSNWSAARARTLAKSRTSSSATARRYRRRSW